MAETNTTQSVVCPLCASRGWPAMPYVGAYQASCGTTWGDNTEPRQADACETIVALRIQVELARAGVDG